MAVPSILMITLIWQYLRILLQSTLTSNNAGNHGGAIYSKITQSIQVISISILLNLVVMQLDWSREHVLYIDVA